MYQFKPVCVCMYVHKKLDFILFGDGCFDSKLINLMLHCDVCRLYVKIHMFQATDRKKNSTFTIPGPKRPDVSNLTANKLDFH